MEKHLVEFAALEKISETMEQAVAQGLDVDAISRMLWYLRDRFVRHAGTRKLAVCSGGSDEVAADRDSA